MLIISIILRITGFTQEELSNYVGISRASINTWLSDDSSMSMSSKKKIAEVFGFPVMFFNYDLNQDIELYRIIYSTIYNSWSQKKPKNSNNKINDILNKIEPDFLPNECYSNEEIIISLINGANPFTGEAFEDDYILKDIRVRRALESLYLHEIGKFGVNNVTKNDLTADERKLFEELRKWRKNKAEEDNLPYVFMVFSDRDLINIIKANIQFKTDLLDVKGIGMVKYQNYADELYNILCLQDNGVN